MLVSIQERFIIKMVRIRYILTKEIIEIKKNVNESMFMYGIIHFVTSANIRDF